jgi:hypothetical protein
MYIFYIVKQTKISNTQIMSSTSSCSCMFCNKPYKTKEKMYKHMVLCETMHRARTRKLIIEDNDDELLVPSPQKMYQIILDLAVKCNKMETELQEMKKWVDKKKRKINVLEWLNSNVFVDSTFDTLAERVEIIDSDIQFLLRNSFYDTLHRIFERSFFKNVHLQMKDGGKVFVSYPLFAFTHKQNVLYTFTDNGTSDGGKKWIESHRDSLVCLFNSLHMKIVCKLMEWKKKNADKMTCGYSDDIYNETVIKLMDIDFKSDSTFGKIRSSIYQKIKINVNDIKTPNMILENCEFE